MGAGDGGCPARLRGGLWPRSLVPGGLEAAEGTARAVADFQLHLSSLQASPERRWRAEAAASYVADLRVSAGTSLPTG